MSIRDLLQNLYGTSTLPIVVQKPWGQEEIYAATDRYVGKILTVNPGFQLSTQYHRAKEESNRVLSGTLVVIKDGISRTLEPGDIWHNNPMEIHSVSVPEGGQPAVFLEVSTPELDDIVRLDDLYGRAGTTKP